jgi:hypothetical protein
MSETHSRKLQTLRFELMYELRVQSPCVHVYMCIYVCTHAGVCVPSLLIGPILLQVWAKRNSQTVGSLHSSPPAAEFPLCPFQLHPSAVSLGQWSSPQNKDNTKIFTLNVGGQCNLPRQEVQVLSEKILLILLFFFLPPPFSSSPPPLPSSLPPLPPPSLFSRDRIALNSTGWSQTLSNLLHQPPLYWEFRLGSPCPAISPSHITKTICFKAPLEICIW